MATRTFTSAGVNNLWSNAANWDTAPVDNDTVVIPNGQTCEFDADMSNAGTWPNGIAGITVTGTLTHTLTAGTYYLKIKAATTISGAGTYNIGTLANPIPFASKHTITGGADWYIQGSGGLTMTVYAAEPVTKTVKLTGAESLGATRLEIDTDLTGDIWAATDTIRIDNVNKAANSESRVISAITATYIDITVGLTAAKIAGTVISLITRNVQIVSVGTSQTTLQNFASEKLTIAGGAFIGSNYRFCTASTRVNISGGTFSGHSIAFTSITIINISDGVFSGNGSYALYACFGIFISGGIFSGSTFLLSLGSGISITGGKFCGSSAAVITSIGANILGGTFSGNSYGLSQCSAKVSGATFSDNTYDLRQVSGYLYNQVISSAVENYEYAFLTRENYLESVNHDNSAGAFKAWTKGGVTTYVASPAPTGFTRSYQLALENASVEGFWQRSVLVPAGATVTFTMYLRKSESMSYKPRCWIFYEGLEPLLSGTPLDEFIYPDDTNDTWATDTYAYTNYNDYDEKLLVRFLGKNATGNVFGQFSTSVYTPTTPAATGDGFVEGWIDALCKVWEIDDGKGNLVWSPRLFERDEFPEALPKIDRPIALSFLVNTATSYSAGGPCINIYSGFTEFHFQGGLNHSQKAYVMKFIRRIEVAAAANARLGGLVDHFMLTPIDGGQPSIQGPVTLQYGDEAEHWGLIVNWEVKENVSGKITVSA